jgi:hypothetical protein
MNNSDTRTLIPRRTSESGVSIVETMVAAGVIVAAVAGLSASAQQALRIARAGKSLASASAIIEERMESFRYANRWTDVTTAAGIASVASSSTSTGGNLANITEIIQVQPYPTGSELVVTRHPDGSFSDNGTDLSAFKCVKLTLSMSGMTVGSTPGKTQFSTVITKGGL